MTEKEIKTIIYVAEDGREFDDKEECEMYDAALYCFTNVSMLDRSLEEKTNDINQAYAIYLPTTEDVNKWILASEYDGPNVEGIDKNKKGVYFYDNHQSKWIFIDDLIEKYEKIKTKLLTN